MPTDEQVHERLKLAFQGRIPRGREIAAAAAARAIRGHEKNREWIKKNFSTLVETVQVDAYNDYLREEAVAGR